MEGERERKDIKERNLLLSAFLAVSARSLLPICVNILDGFFSFSPSRPDVSKIWSREKGKERERESRLAIVRECQCSFSIFLKKSCLDF